MELNTDICYEALLARDARFDGTFYVGVSSTGIYCRPICGAKTPRREHCAFYTSAAAAERAGFRPCLRCRPEMAPGNARCDSVGRIAAAAMSRIEEGALTEMRVEDLAAELGVSGRHLRRVVEREFGVAPVELAQTHRLLSAKRLLTDTNLSVTEIAYASGFSSLRRLNSLFRERYRLNPTEMRRGRAETGAREILVCEIAYRPPLDWAGLRSFLAARVSSGMEAFEDCRYLRTVALAGARGWIGVGPSPCRNTLRVEVSASLSRALQPVTAGVKRLFDLCAEPRRIGAHLGPLAADHPGLRVPGAFDGFEIAVRAILGQQVSVKAATTLAGRFVHAFGEPIETPWSSLTHLPPAVERVARAEIAEITALGIVTTRARAIVALARAVLDRRIAFGPGADVGSMMERLCALPGVGEWTAQYIAMRAFAWPDAFPHTDLGIRKALGEDGSRRVLAIAEAWRPWRAYAAMHLWRSLEDT